MSGFFKRFKGGINETTNKEVKDERKSEEPSLDSPCTELTSNERLSLFSGMTFNTAISIQESTVNRPKEHVKTASEELAEAGLDLIVKKPLYQNDPSKPSSPEKVVVKSNVDEAVLESSQTTQLGSNVLQHGKKKKKTQAKRPGYARDSKSTKSNEKCITSEQQKDARLAFPLNTANKPEPSHGDPEPLYDKQMTSIIDNTTDQPNEGTSKDDDNDGGGDDVSDNGDDGNDDGNGDGNDGNDDGNGNGDDDYRNDDGVGDNINVVPAKDGDSDDDNSDNHDDDNDGNNDDDDHLTHKETPRKDFHHLYSIGTPSSSEENLYEHEEPQEKKDNENIDQVDATNNSGDCSNKDTGTDRDEKEESLKYNENVETSQYSHRGDILNHELKFNVKLGVEHEKNISEEENSANKDIESLVKNEDEPCDIQDKKLEKSYEMRVDAEDKLIMIQQDMVFRISSLKDDEESLTDLNNYIKENYSSLKTVYLAKQQELNSLIQEESNAIANDNYDLAEELAVKIEQIEEDLENTKYKVPTVDVEVQQALQLASELALRTLAIRREAQASLQEFKEEQVAQLDSYKEENTSRISKEKQQLNLEKQRIERTRAHLELDSEHLTKEQNILEEEIHGKTEGFVTRKKELAEERQHIQQEISELEERLVQLRLKESQYKDEIIAEEIKVAEVLEEFLPQRDVLDLQRKDLENQQKQLDEQQELLTSSQEVYNKLVQEWDSRQTRLSEFLESVETAIGSNNSIISHLENKRGKLEQFQCIKHLSLTTDPVLEKLKSSAKRSSQQIKLLKTNINLSNRTILSLRKRLSEIEDQISERNEGKDIAKKERNFKEAKRLKEEGEALNNEGMENQKQLEHILEELNRDTQELENTEKDFGNISKELKQKEIESDTRLVKTCAQVVDELQHQMDRYKQDDMLYILLTAECYTCQNLIKELCSKHGIDAPEAVNFDTTLPHTNDSEPHSQETVDDKDSLQSLVDELEIKLEAVVDLEDFDEAERIQQQIDEMKSRLK